MPPPLSPVTEHLIHMKSVTSEQIRSHIGCQTNHQRKSNSIKNNEKQKHWQYDHVRLAFFNLD